MSEKTMIRDLTNGNVVTQLLTFSFPFMLSNLLQTVYNLVDMVVIGNVCGSAGLSGVSIGGEMLHLFTFICMGFCSAGQILISQLVGANDRKGVSRMIGNLFTFIFLLGLVFMVLGLCGVDLLLSQMNTPAEAFSQARDYTVVCFWGVIFIFGYNIVSAILRGMGDSRRPFLFIAIASVLNLLLDLLFIIGFRMEAKGAALATVIGQGVSFLISMVYLYLRRAAFGFDFSLEGFRPEKRYLLPILRIGTPLAIQQCAIILSSLFVQSYINAYGLVVCAVNSVGNKLSSVMSVVTSAINNAGSSMIGQNLGAGKTRRVNKIIGSSFVFCMVIAMCLSVLMVLFPRQIFGFFDNDADVLAMAVTFVPIAVLNFFAFAMRAPFNALVNGLGYASLGLVIGIVDGVIARIGLTLLLGVALGFGIQGFWYGNVIAGYATFFIGGAYYLSGRWKNRKPVIR